MVMLFYNLSFSSPLWYQQVNENICSRRQQMSACVEVIVHSKMTRSGTQNLFYYYYYIFSSFYLKGIG